MKPLIVDNKYQLDLRLGGGSFGEVYQGHNLETEQEVALKLEYGDPFPSHLQNEMEVYEELAGGTGIPQMFWKGEDDQFRIMAFELLGPSLEDLLHYCGGKLSLKTVLMLADQLIPRFQYIHSKGYIHRDIKPSNILMGTGRKGNTVYVADMGTAKEIDLHRRRTYALVGTVSFANISSHKGTEQFPRDEMESLGYSLIFLLRGAFPWDSVKASSEEKKNNKILEMKQSPEECGLFDGLPADFKKYFEHLRLGSPTAVNYSYLRKLFTNLFHRNNYDYDFVFDWTELKFLEMIKAKELNAKCEKDDVEMEEVVD